VAVVKIFDPKLKRLEDRLGDSPHARSIAFSNSLNGFWDDLDIVSICTPEHTHFEYAAEAVRRGLHTLVEKPMFVTRKECDEIGALLKGYSGVFGVHHQMRYVPAFKAARELVARGRVGQVVAMQADYIHDMRYRATMYDDWRLDSLHPENIVLSGMCHTLDLLRWIAGEMPDRVVAMAGHRGWPEYPEVDSVMAILHFPSGIIATTAKTIASRGPQRNTLIVYGTNGQVHNNVFRDADGHLTITAGSLPITGLWGQLSKYLGPVASRAPHFREFPFSVYDHEAVCYALLQEYLDAVRGAREFSVGFEEGRTAVEMCLACIESYRESRPVEIV
jgi:predicted dehydrogenase